jgi:hypothetical protein
MMEAPGSSETSVLTRATRRNNPENTILHSHRRENLKSYMTWLIAAVNANSLEYLEIVFHWTTLLEHEPTTLLLLRLLLNLQAN